MFVRFISISVLFLSFAIFTSAQTGEAKSETKSTAKTLMVEKEKKPAEEIKLIQFSGLLLSDGGDNLVPVPYATIYLPEKQRGTYSDARGFFTLVVEKKDKIRFSGVGFETVSVTIPDSLTADRYSVVQLMSQDTINLPETIIFAWPSKEHFKIEFLKMDVSSELARRAAENLANEYLADARKNDDIVPYSGREGASFYMRQQSKDYLYLGQTPPMNIFSPLAWGKFFQAWKEGKFKKQKEDE